MKMLVTVLIITAIWFVLACVRNGRGEADAVAGGTDAWMIDQHDPVVRLGHDAAIPSGHPLARLSLDPPERRG
jgi:hypothetical protein